jgi:hypothetical protein
MRAIAGELHDARTGRRILVLLDFRIDALDAAARGSGRPARQREGTDPTLLYILKAGMDVKTAIENGDADALQRMLRADRSLANELISWGGKTACLTHPLHYVSDMLFEGKLAKGPEVPLVEVLIEAGAHLNFQRDRDDGKKSDTPLIGAASLGAEEVGVRLLDAGARPELRGMFGETALHWAALLGEDKLVARLIESLHANLSVLNLKDEKYKSPPLGWAVHGWSSPPAGNHGRQREVVALLVAAGAVVESGLLESDGVRANPAILTALRGANS